MLNTNLVNVGDFVAPMRDMVFAHDMEPLAGPKPPSARDATGYFAEGSMNLYDRVTESILVQLEQGTPPWIKPWVRNSRGIGTPHNAVSGHIYAGINTILLWAEGAHRGFGSSGWMTLNQIKALGAHLRKIDHDPRRPSYTGQQPAQIVKWGTFEKEKTSRNGEVSKEKRAFLRTFYVFNEDQVEGLPPEKVAPPDVLPTLEEGIKRAEAWVKELGVNVAVGGNDACYSPLSDMVRVPAPIAFIRNARDDGTKASAHYTATLLHEIGHWTGAPHRMKRLKGAIFGSPDYAREELVAELFSAMMCARWGLPAHLQHASYIDHWIDVLKADNRAIFIAASAAKKAIEWCDRCVGDVIHPAEEAVA